MSGVTQKLDALKNDDPRAKELELTTAEIAELAAQDALAQIKDGNQNMRDMIATKRSDQVEEEISGGSEEKDVKSKDDLDDSDPKIIVKVDGVKESLTQEELDKKVEAYQKHKAADVRMQESVLLKKELEREKATLGTLKEDLEQQKKDLEDKLKTAATKKDVKEATEDLQLNKEEIAKVVTSIREGEDEDAVESMFNFMSKMRSPSQEPQGLSEEEVTSRVNDAVLTALKKQKEADVEEQQATFEEERQKAADVFEVQFSKQIEEEEDFYSYTVIQDQKLQKDPEWVNKPLSDRFVEAGRRTEAMLSGVKLTEDKSDEDDSTSGTKTNKDKIENLSSQSNTRAKIGEDDVERTPIASILNDIRKGRHQN